MPLLFRLVAVCCCLALLAGPADTHAQIGLQVGLFCPEGALGMTYKRATAYNLYYVSASHNQRWRTKFGLFYTHPAPRQQVASTWAYSGNPATFYPGYIEYRSYSMQAITADMEWDVIRRNGFAIYGGFGILGGKSNTQFRRVVETLVDEQGDEDKGFIAIRLSAGASYDIGKHLNLYATAIKAFTKDGDNSSIHDHHLFSLGLNVRFKAREEE